MSFYLDLRRKIVVGWVPGYELMLSASHWQSEMCLNTTISNPRDAFRGHVGFWLMWQLVECKLINQYCITLWCCRIILLIVALSDFVFPILATSVKDKRSWIMKPTEVGFWLQPRHTSVDLRLWVDIRLSLISPLKRPSMTMKSYDRPFHIVGPYARKK